MTCIVSLFAQHTVVTAIFLLQNFYREYLDYIFELPWSKFKSCFHLHRSEQREFHCFCNYSNLDYIMFSGRWYVVCEVSRHFRKKKKAYLTAKIEELETNSKIQNTGGLYRGIIDFKKGYQPRCNIVKDEKGDLVADSHSIVARWRNYFSQLFNVHGVKDVGQAEIHTAEPLVSDPSATEVELVIAS